MGDAFLGVESSLSGKRWELRPGDERVAVALSQRFSLPEIVGRILASRDVGLDDAESFLDPKLRDLLPDPCHLKDMEVGAARLVSAITAGELIAIFGDYDVDGATSSALLTRLVQEVGGRSITYIPDRLKEGYGPNESAMETLRGQGASVVVTVDCGTTSYQAIDKARKIGLDVVVVDHHVAEPKLPDALAIINPNRIDESSPYRSLAAVGVTFLLAVAVNRMLRAQGWYENRPEPDLMGWLDIVALGTVCDVVPLVGVNRALVVQGLKVLVQRRKPGISALIDIAGISEVPTAYHLGYVLGPRVNAGGRVGDAELGTRLLSTESMTEAHMIAEKLNTYNGERRDIEALVLEQAITQAEMSGDNGSGALLFVHGNDWHPGVIGIVASRLKERYGIPACVASVKDGVVTGSGRSIKGVDMGTAILAATQSGILTRGGGHAMAAGFSLDINRLDAFKAFLAERFSAQIARAKIVPTLTFDGAVSLSGVTLDLIRNIEKVGPFGAGNAEPRFALAHVSVAYAKAVGHDQKHLSCTLTDSQGGRIRAMAFNGTETPFGRELLTNSDGKFHLSGKIRINNWQGSSSPQLLIDDAAKV